MIDHISVKVIIITYHLKYYGSTKGVLLFSQDCIYDTKMKEISLAIQSILLSSFPLLLLRASPH